VLDCFPDPSVAPPPMPTSSLELPYALDLAEAAPDAARLEAEVIHLFDAHADGLRRYVRSFGLSPAAAEDVVQEVFLGLFRHLRLGRPRHNLTGWLFRVAHNLALKQRKQQARWLGAADAFIAALADPAGGPEDQMADAQRRARLRSVARALPERDRRCLHLRCEGLNYRDIAGVLGVSLGWVSKSMTRALTRLMRADSM